MALNDKWVYYLEDEVASTNDEIQKYCNEPNKYVVVCAKKQTAGRGRRGRNWSSCDGNLF